MRQKRKLVAEPLKQKPLKEPLKKRLVDALKSKLDTLQSKKQQLVERLKKLVA